MNGQVKITTTDFDPELFGFNSSYMSKTGRSAKGGDYLLLSKKKAGDAGDYGLQLSLSEETGKFVRELLGERVDVALDKKGRIVLYEGKGRSVSTCGGHKHGKPSRRFIVSLNVMTGDYVKAHGTFKRAYMKAEPYSNFNAVLFTPTGERDQA